MMKIYIDGCCAVHTSKNGAWAYLVVVDDKIIHEDSGFEEHTTNQRMELMSGLSASRWLWANGLSAEIVSDSAYLVNGMNSWVHNWVKNGWITSAGEPVKNKHLWEVLYNGSSLIEGIKWTLIRGHNGDKWNEYVDHLCQLVANQTPVGELKTAESCYTTNQ